MIYIRVTCLTQSLSFFKSKKCCKFLFCSNFCCMSPLTGLVPWVEMSHLNVSRRTVGYVNVCLKIPANGAKDGAGFLCFFGFRSSKIEVLRKFWKRQCVEKLQGVETETPRQIISSVEDEPSMKVVILGGIRFPLLWFLKKENQNRKVSVSKFFHKLCFDGCEKYVRDISRQIIATKPPVGHPKWWFTGIPPHVLNSSLGNFSNLPRYLFHFAVVFFLGCLLHHAPSLCTPCRPTGPGAGNGSNTDPDSNMSITRCLRERTSAARQSWSYQLHVE